jgi:hypothetical protein
MPLVHKNKKVKTWTQCDMPMSPRTSWCKDEKACNQMSTLNILGLQWFRNSNNGHTQLTKMDFWSTQKCL